MTPQERQQFIEGIQARTPALRGAIQSALGTAQMTLAGTDVSPVARGSLARGMASGIRPNQGTFSFPSFTVMIGNKAVNDHVRLLIHDNNQARDRRAAQGVRR